MMRSKSEVQAQSCTTGYYDANGNWITCTPSPTPTPGPTAAPPTCYCTGCTRDDNSCIRKSRCGSCAAGGSGEPYAWWCQDPNQPPCGGGNPGDPPEPTGTVQGFKVVMPGNAHSEPAASQTVQFDADPAVTDQPYFFTGELAGAHTVNVSVPANYYVGSTQCTGYTDCHSDAPVSGATAPITIVDGSYVDLWWHYAPVVQKTCNIKLSKNLGAPGETIKIDFNANSGGYNPESARLWIERADGAAITDAPFATLGNNSQMENAGFDDNNWPSGWNFGPVNRAVYAGGYLGNFLEVNQPCPGCQSDLGPTDYSIYQDIVSSYVAGSYTLSYYAKAAVNGAVVNPLVWEDTGSGWVLMDGDNNQALTTTWTKYSLPGTTLTAGSKVRVQFNIVTPGVNIDFDQVMFDQTSVSTVPTRWNLAAPYYAFDDMNCITRGFGACIGGGTVTLPAGNYEIHCDLPSNPRKCSGNPFCTINGNGTTCNTTGTPACTDCVATGWEGCLGNDTVNYCAEGGAVVGGWQAWNACTGTPTFNRTRTRTCTEDCGTNDCAAYFANPANCPVGSTCTYASVGTTTTQTETQPCVGTLQGTFFDASYLSACPADPQTLTADLKVAGGTINAIGSRSYSALTDGNGFYTIPVSIQDTLNLTEAPPAPYITSPKLFCQGTSAQFINQGDVKQNDFGFWKIFGGWFQARGGSVYAGTGISTTVPPSMVGFGHNFIVPSIGWGQTGIARIGAGSIFLGSDNPPISVTGWNALSSFKGDNQDYTYFNNKMGIFDKTAWDGASNVSYSPGGNDYQIYKHTGAVTFDAGQAPAAGQKMIYLIDGDVTVTQNIPVPSTSFLAVIASGTIHFQAAVTAVTGWYVANTIDIQSTGNKATEAQFVGTGSFVGFTSINLTRDMGAANNTSPAQLFDYSPELLLNAPDPMRTATTRWQQINP